MWLRHHRDDRRRHGPVQESPKTQAPKATLQDRIRQRAYEMFQGKSGGSDTQDWLRAEGEILHEKTSQNKPGMPAPK